MTSYVGVGARLREERNRLDLNQTQMAAYGGVSLQSQFNYEQDKRSPDAAYLAAIAEAGVDILYVITGKRTPRAGSELTVEEARLVTNYNATSDTDRAAASQLLESLARKKSA